MLRRSVMSDFLQPHGLYPTRLLCPWGFSRQEYQSAMGCHALLQGIFPTQESNPDVSHCRLILYPLLSEPLGKPIIYIDHLSILYMLRCPVVSDSFATPWTVAHQFLLFMGFSRQDFIHTVYLFYRFWWYLFYIKC